MTTTNPPAYLDLLAVATDVAAPIITDGAALRLTTSVVPQDLNLAVAREALAAARKGETITPAEIAAIADVVSLGVEYVRNLIYCGDLDADDENGHLIAVWLGIDADEAFVTVLAHFTEVQQ